MKVIATDCMYLAGREGQFTPNGESESIKYQNAEFFQKGSDASIKLALSNDLKPENFGITSTISASELSIFFRAAS